MSRNAGHNGKPCPGYEDMLRAARNVYALSLVGRTRSESDLSTDFANALQRALDFHRNRCPYRSLQSASSVAVPLHGNSSSATISPGSINEASGQGALARAQGSQGRTGENSSVTRKESTSTPVNNPPNILSAPQRVNRIPLETPFRGTSSRPSPSASSSQVQQEQPTAAFSTVIKDEPTDYETQNDEDIRSNYDSNTDSDGDRDVQSNNDYSNDSNDNDSSADEDNDNSSADRENNDSSADSEDNNSSAESQNNDSGAESEKNDSRTASEIEDSDTGIEPQRKFKCENFVPEVNNNIAERLRRLEALQRARAQRKQEAENARHQTQNANNIAERLRRLQELRMARVKRKLEAENARREAEQAKKFAERLRHLDTLRLAREQRKLEAENARREAQAAKKRKAEVLRATAVSQLQLNEQ